MRKWRLDLDWCTSRIETPVWKKSAKKNVQVSSSSSFFFSSQLELTFSLAVNETKQRRVIRVDVFIRGFYRKLISSGMQSCAKLMASGGWGVPTFLQERGGLRICIYIRGLHRVGRRTFSFKQFKTRIVFPVQTAGRSSDVVWLGEKPAKVPFEITHETDSGDSETRSLQMLLIHFKYETLVPQNIAKCAWWEERRRRGLERVYTTFRNLLLQVT